MHLSLKEAEAELLQRAKDLGAGPNIDPYNCKDEVSAEKVLIICHRLDELDRVMEELIRER